MAATAEVARPAKRHRTRGVAQHTQPPTAAFAVVPPTARPAVVINLRAPIQARELIDCAAAAEGKTRTEFMLDSACRRAQEVLLEKRLFVIEPEKYEAVLRLLDSPPPPNSALKRLLLGKSPWEK